MIFVGFFSKLLGKHEGAAQGPACEPLTVYTPAEGEVIPLEQFPDELFSQEVLGPGCGILPTGKLVTAPFHGTVVQGVDSRHAIGLNSEDGIELLIHVGVDTVEMEGQGFQYHVKEGQKVRLGDPLISFDREAIKAAGHPDAIAVVVTNSDAFSGVSLLTTGSAASGVPMLKANR